MALWSMVRRLFVRLVSSCCRCNCFSISDMACMDVEPTLKALGGLSRNVNIAPLFDRDIGRLQVLLTISHGDIQHV